MPVWPARESQYHPVASQDPSDKSNAAANHDTGPNLRLSHDSGSSHSLTGNPIDSRDHRFFPPHASHAYAGGYERDDAEDIEDYPPDIKRSLIPLYPSQSSKSKTRRLVIALSATVVVLTLLLATATASFLLSTTKVHGVANIAQDAATAAAAAAAAGTSKTLDEYIDSSGSNATVDEALARLREEGWIPIDPRKSSPFVPAHRPLKPLSSQLQTPYVCAEQWIAHATVCEGITSKKNPLKNSEMDVVWTWVTANEHWSGWRERLSRGAFRLRWKRWRHGKFGVAAKNAKDKHFRSHHQLQYSQRSVMKNIPWARKLHLLANDLPACDPTDVRCSNTYENRIGQVPDWLDVKKVSKDEKFGVQFHWDLFKADDEDAGAWRMRTLPTFDSLSIESQLANVHDAAENILYMNDDSYVLRETSPADFATPLFGQVFRIQKDLGVGGEAPGTSKQKADGEWPSMTYSNWLLDNRFGVRKRSYLIHQSKVMSGPLLDELASVWAQELKETAEVRFRGKSAELNMLFLSTYYVIEKHREVLLWSYLVARMDSTRKGIYTAEDRAAIRADLAANVVNDTMAVVARPKRPSYEGSLGNDLLSSAGLDLPKATPYQFSSVNGYAFVPLGQNPAAWPDFDNITVRPDKPQQVCHIDLEQCFGSQAFFEPDFNGQRASQWLFKRMAFERPECGDCAIVALLSKDQQGLEAFLPSADGKAASSPFDSTMQTVPPPMLGSWDKTWQNTDFSLWMALRTGEWNLREYTVRLLQRYSYVIGNMPTRFIGLQRPLQVLRDLKDLTHGLEDPEGPVLLTMNDDIAKAAYVKIVDDNLALWHEKTWPDPTPFELNVEKVEVQPIEESISSVAEQEVPSEGHGNSGQVMGISIAITPPR